MDDAFLSDLTFLLDHIYREQEKAVKRWSTVEWSDNQVPLALLCEFLSGALIPPDKPVMLKLRETREFHALIEIIENSQLRSLLQVDRQTASIRYRDGTPREAIVAISEFVSKYVAGCY